MLLWSNLDREVILVISCTNFFLLKIKGFKAFSNKLFARAIQIMSLKNDDFKSSIIVENTSSLARKS